MLEVFPFHELSRSGEKSIIQPCQQGVVARQRERARQHRALRWPERPTLRRAQRHAACHGDKTMSGERAGEHQRPAARDASESDDAAEAQTVAIGTPAQG